MKNCKRPLMNQERDFYEIPTDCSEEEIQRGSEFVKRLKTMDDQSIFDQYVDAMKSYQSGSLSFTDLKNRIVYILGNHEGLVEEFHQLLSDLASLGGRNSIKDLQQTVHVFLNKVEALDKGLYKVFLDAFRSPGGIEALIEQLDAILRDHAPLKEEFITLLIDSRLLNPKRDTEEEAKPSPEDKQDEQKISVKWKKVTPSYQIRPGAEEGKWKKVTPSYRIRPGAEVGSCSSDEVLNNICVSMGEYFDPDKVVKTKRLPLHYERMNDLEDNLYDKDMLLEPLTSVIKFGKDVWCEKPPVGFDEIIKWYYEVKEMPQIFKTDPKPAKGVPRRGRGTFCGGVPPLSSSCHANAIIQLDGV
ncbi:unnamed protein product [Arabis nemorensis]|uniref:Histone deacetylase interacting domain-containing protein n=1 Tax=Arabis nemorensis TaxID=586526 RepID=A0A565BBF6_9BRAS|nr:unnamed protein product [Arabis nemorensis]